MATAVTAHAAENRRATMRSTRRPLKCERTLASVKHQVTVRPRSATEGHVGVDVRRQGGRGEGVERRRHHCCGGEHDPGLERRPHRSGARPPGVGHRCGLTAGCTQRHGPGRCGPQGGGSRQSAGPCGRQAAWPPAQCPRKVPSRARPRRWRRVGHRFPDSAEPDRQRSTTHLTDWLQRVERSAQRTQMLGGYHGRLHSWRNQGVGFLTPFRDSGCLARFH